MFVLGNRTSAFGTASSLSVSRPSGTIKVGDLLIAHIAMDNHTVGRATISTRPSGWNTIQDSKGYSNSSHAVLYKVATSSEPSSYSFSFGFSDEASIHIVHVTTDSSAAVKLGIGTSASSTSGTASSLSVSKPYLYMTFFAAHGTSILGNPSGLTLAWSDKLINYGSSSVGYKQMASGGSSGSSSSSGATLAISIAIISESQPPTQPGAISNINEKVYLTGETINISWGPSSQPEGHTVTYNIELYDGTEWKTLKTGATTNSIELIIPSDINTPSAQLRVIAVESGGLTSAPRESGAFIVREYLVLVQEDGNSIKTYKNGSWQVI